MAKYSIEDTTLIAAADAIREKEGSTNPIPPEVFGERIRAIQTGIQLPTLTNPGTAADLLIGKQLIDQYGNPLTGTMPEVEQATPSISVSSAGLITAQATQEAGHVAAGTKSATKQLTTKAAATITPGTADQSIAAGTFLAGTQIVKGDANLLAENIKSGVSIFGVAGSYGGPTITKRRTSTIAYASDGTISIPTIATDMSQVVNISVRFRCYINGTVCFVTIAGIDTGSSYYSYATWVHSTDESRLDSWKQPVLAEVSLSNGYIVVDGNAFIVGFSGSISSLYDTPTVEVWTLA